MPVWAALVVSVCVGGLVGAEAWSWMRHGTSAIARTLVVLLAIGAAAAGIALVVALGSGSLP